MKMRSPRTRKLPLYRPWLDDDEIDAVAQVLRSGWIGMGERVAEFEDAFAQQIGAEHAVAVNSCTAALHLSLVAAGIGPGDAVITTPFTFTATAEAVLHAGAAVRFVDIEPDTLNLDPDAVAEAIDARTKAILPVHIAGLPCDMGRLARLADEHHLFLLDDAAHALMAETEGCRIGTIGDATAFSFYPTKHITTLEGGMVTTKHDEIADRVRRIRYHARTRDTWALQNEKRPWVYDVVEQGFKCNMTDVQAAMGLCQLRKFDRQMAIRDRIAARYREAFADLPEIELPAEPHDGRHTWHLYIIRLNTDRLVIDRDRFVFELNERQIGASVHYIPLHLLTHYQKICRVREGDFPNAERAYARVVSLPFWPGMSEEDTEDVVQAVTSVVRASVRRRST